MSDAALAVVCVLIGSGLTLSVQWVQGKEQERNKFRLAALDKRLEKHTSKTVKVWEQRI